MIEDADYWSEGSALLHVSQLCISDEVRTKTKVAAGKQIYWEDYLFKLPSDVTRHREIISRNTVLTERR